LLSAVGTSEPARTRSERGRIGLRETGLVSFAGALLSVAMNWPLALHPGSRISEDLGDPVRTAWQLAWQGHAVLHNPSAFYESNAFWPLPHTFAFSDSLLGYLPASLIGSGAEAALVRYNLLFLFAYALCFVGAYLLARELGAGRLGSAVAGVAFAYAPFKLSLTGHLHVISSGGIPLALFLLVRGYRRGSPRMVVAGWLVAAWQLTLGFTLGLQLAYLLAVIAAIAAVVWLARGRPRLPRSLVAATLAGAVVFAGVGAFQARPLLRVSHDYPQAKRGGSEIAHFSAPLKAFVSAPVEDRVWGGPTASIRNSLKTQNEQNQFPGVTVALLALVGLVAGTAFTRRLRAGLAVGVVVTAALALGYGILDGDLTYRLLHDYGPGWEGVRTPGRLATLTSLGLALLAAAGVDRLAGAAARRSGRQRMALLAPPALAVVLAGGVLVEGLGSVPHPSVPPVPSGEDAAAAPQVHLPTNPAFDRVYQFWSSNRFQPIANGVATFSVYSQDVLRRRMASFPDAPSVAFLRRRGIRSVILHLDLESRPIPRKERNPFPRSPRRAARRSVAGLPLTRERRPGYVLYRLAPLPGRRG
jgi:hypothetical protein